MKKEVLFSYQLNLDSYQLKISSSASTPSTCQETFNPNLYTSYSVTIKPDDCLSYIPESKFDEIHFFGDKTFEGGNDYEIFHSSRVIGHYVSSPKDTMEKCKQLFM